MDTQEYLIAALVVVVILAAAWWWYTTYGPGSDQSETTDDSDSFHGANFGWRDCDVHGGCHNRPHPKGCNASRAERCDIHCTQAPHGETYPNCMEWCLSGGNGVKRRPTVPSVHPQANPHASNPHMDYM
jgi:hypothetical protein